MVWESSLVIFSLVMIACFSAAETSFVSSDKVSMVVRSGSGYRLDAFLYFLRNNDLFFATVVLASNLFITVFSLLAEIVFHERFGVSLLVVVPLTTIIGFVVGELIPKSVALETPETTARFTLPFVQAFHRIAKPLIGATARFSTWAANRIFHTGSRSMIFQKRDVYRLLGETVTGGYLDKIESEVIRRLLANGRDPVRTIAVPRTSIVAASMDTSIDKLRSIFEKSKKTKVIVYSTSLDNIVGVVHAKDVFKEADTVKDVLSDVLFVPEAMQVVDLLEEFRAVGLYVAVLIDEFGGTSGLVTSTDVMELFLGEVATRFAEERITQIRPKHYLMQGITEIDEIERTLKVKLPKSSEYTSIGGLMTYKVGRIPVVGETLQVGRFELRVQKADGKKVEVVEFSLR